MLELPNEEVQLERGFRLHGVEVRHYDISQDLAEMPHLLRAFLLVRLCVQLHQFAFNASYLCECFDDGERGFCRAAAFQNRRQHVKAFLGESLGQSPAFR